MSAPRRRRMDGQVRTAAIVAIATIVLWFSLSWLGGAAGVEARYAFLLDFAAMGAFAWVIIVGARAWRNGKRRERSDA